MNNAFQEFHNALGELKNYYQVSSCCRSGLKVVSSDEGTQHYVCVSCDKPCDVIPLCDAVPLTVNPVTTIYEIKDTESETPSMKIAYVSGRYRSWIHIGKWRIKNPIGIAWNIWKARQVAMRLWNQGYACICPHLNTAHFDGLVHDEAFMNGDLEIIKRLRIKKDCIYMMKGFRQSEGSLRELALAKRRRLKVMYE